MWPWTQVTAKNGSRKKATGPKQRTAKTVNEEEWAHTEAEVIEALEVGQQSEGTGQPTLGMGRSRRNRKPSAKLR